MTAAALCAPYWLPGIGNKSVSEGRIAGRPVCIAVDYRRALINCLAQGLVTMSGANGSLDVLVPLRARSWLKIRKSGHKTVP